MALTNADLRRGQSTGIYLNQALLRGARFENAALEGAHFSGAFLIGADLSHARLANADFSGAWLFGAKFEGAYQPGLSGGYYDPQPILNWLRETLGGSSWEWASLRKCLETPSDNILSDLRKKLSPSAGRGIEMDQAQEGLRQIRSLLEKKLAASEKEREIPEARVDELLQVHGLREAAASAVGDSQSHGNKRGRDEL